MKELKGLGVSAGMVAGRALVLKQESGEVRFCVPASEVERQVARLESARQASRRQLAEIKVRVSGLAGAEHAYLFEPQLLMLDDPFSAAGRISTSSSASFTSPVRMGSGGV